MRQEQRAYQYDFLDRLTFAGVYAGPQMIEERYYTYDQIGNLLSFRHRYPAAGQGRGAFAAGGAGAATTTAAGPASTASPAAACLQPTTPAAR